MDLEVIMLSEISHTEKDKYCMISTYIWNLINKNEQTHAKNRNILIDKENKLVVVRGEGGEINGQNR